MRNTLFAFLLLTATGFSQPIGVQLDGRWLQFDQPPVSSGGRLMVPLRGIFESLQADVVYDARTRSIKATKGSTVVELTLGSRQAMIDGRPVYLDVPADTLGGRTMVPLRFVSESLGAEVKWDGAQRTVRLSSGQTPTAPVTPAPIANKPNLQQIIHNATRTLGAGDSFDVIMVGDPGAQASFEILGALKAQPVPEVRPGHYETRFTIPGGLQVERGVLVGHLTLGGQEVLAEAKRTLTIQGTGGAARSEFQLTPLPNSEVREGRPSIRIQFDQAYRTNSLRLYLDQVELTNSIQQVNPREVQLTPQFDLNPGQHRVEAEALDGNGQRLNPQWSFTVSPRQYWQGNSNLNAISAINLSSSSAFTGQGVQIEVLGPPGAQATVSIGSGRATPMQEIGSGRYVAQYVVQNQDRGTQQATAQLRLPNGQILSQASSTAVTFNANGNNLANEVVGTYRHDPVQNNWHEGDISALGNGDLRWTNRAGVSWNLHPGNGDVLLKDAGSPYQNQNFGTQFLLVRGPSREITGFRFNNDLYNRVQPGQTPSLLNVNNLFDGQLVPVNFNVRGSGPALGQITLTVRFVRPSLVGVLTGQQEVFSVNGSIDSNGSFVFPLNIASVPINAQFTLTVTDSANSPAVTRTLQRQ